MVKLKKIGESKIFGGWTKMFQHYSKSCSCVMKFSVFLPPQMGRGPVPVLTWLSGLTCTHENFITKAGAQKSSPRPREPLADPDAPQRKSRPAGRAGPSEATARAPVTDLNARARRAHLPKLRRKVFTGRGRKDGQAARFLLLRHGRGPFLLWPGPPHEAPPHQDGPPFDFVHWFV